MNSPFVEYSTEIFVLIGGILLFISLLASKTSDRFGVPVLLLFLLIGFAVGKDGLGIIHFDDPKFAQSLGILALSIILFSGGMDTKFAEIKPVLLPGIILATVGVLLTAAITGLFIFAVTKNIQSVITFTMLQSLLLASVMSSTDSASVFAILRSKNMSLKQNLRPLLELESGSNDPMAYMLTIVLIPLCLNSDICTINGWNVALMLLMQLVLGAASGILLGYLAVKIINKINLTNDALYSVLLLALMLIIFGITHLIKGNGYLAVYLGGLVVGNQRFVRKRSTQKFFDGLTWLAQIVIFLTLGLLVSPKELLEPSVWILGISIGIFMMVIARPATIFLSLMPFKKMTVKARTFVSWVGLRGAVPIIFATYPMVENVPHARQMFNIVFFITILSLLFQGTQVSNMGKWLKLSTPAPRKNKFRDFDVDGFSDDIKSAMREILVSENMLKNGHKLIHLNMPENTLVTMVKHGDTYFIPNGNTYLEAGDSILVIADSEAKIEETMALLTGE
jgi:cell volume regulation protein A